MLSTLHTNNSVGAIPRLIDLGAEPFLLSSVLNMVMAQRLARKICPDCKTEAEIPPSMLDRIREQLSTIPESYINEIDIKNLKFWRWNIIFNQNFLCFCLIQGYNCCFRTRSSERNL